MNVRSCGTDWNGSNGCLTGLGCFTALREVSSLLSRFITPSHYHRFPSELISNPIAAQSSSSSLLVYISLVARTSRSRLSLCGALAPLVELIWSFVKSFILAWWKKPYLDSRGRLPCKMFNGSAASQGFSQSRRTISWLICWNMKLYDTLNEQDNWEKREPKGKHTVPVVYGFTFATDLTVDHCTVTGTALHNKHHLFDAVI